MSAISLYINNAKLNWTSGSSQLVFNPCTGFMKSQLC